MRYKGLVLTFNFENAVRKAHAGQNGVVMTFVKDNYLVLEMLSGEYAFEQIAPIVNKTVKQNYSVDLQLTPGKVRLAFESIEHQIIYFHRSFKSFKDTWAPNRIERTLRQAIKNEDIELLKNDDVYYLQSTLRKIDAIHSRPDLQIQWSAGELYYVLRTVAHNAKEITLWANQTKSKVVDKFKDALVR